MHALTNFLKPDPLSFYEPETTFATESGLEAVLAMADRHLRTWAFHYSSGDCNISIPLGTEYLFSELSLYGKTDGTGGYMVILPINCNLPVV